MKMSQFPKKSGRIQAKRMSSSVWGQKGCRNSLRKAGEYKSTSQVIDTSHIHKVK